MADYVRQTEVVDGETGALGIGVYFEAQALDVHCNKKSSIRFVLSKKLSQILHRTQITFVFCVKSGFD